MHGRPHRAARHKNGLPRRRGSASGDAVQARIKAAQFTGEEDRSIVNKQVLEFMWLISRGVEQAVEQRLAQTTGLRWLSFGMRRKTHPLPPAETGAGISMSGPKKEAWN